ncbi:MAG TPA: dihydrofolate reductase family protein [Solirubrobacterales bacterium]|nr:dihydrofolate reductase family protein [Solirubrobacterales bacterium]
MGKVTFDLSMSLDGFITGPDDNPQQGLGEGGERLHEWIYDLESFHSLHGREGGEQNRDSEILQESFSDVRGVVIGRRMYDNAHEQWGENPPFPGRVHIVTHRGQDPIVKGQTTYNFVTGGIESALDEARADAAGKDVAIAGGADVVQQYLRAGLVDEFQVHVVPLFLGGGRRLFENLGDAPQLETVRVVESPRVTHIKFRVLR